MAEVAQALDRLSTGHAKAQADSWARRRHVHLLLLAVLLAAVTRWVAPLPGLRALVGAFGAAVLVAAALLAAGLLLRAVAAAWLRVPAERLAAELDDREGWKDTLTTALSVERRSAPGLLPDVLRSQAALFLGGLPVPTAPARPGGRALPWGRIGLAALFVALLLLPGVRGGAQEGAGRGGALGPGTIERPTPGGPYDADQWLREHARLLLTPRDPTGTQDPTGLIARFHTLRALPADYAGELTLVLDDALVVPVGPLAGARGAVVREERVLDLGAVAELSAALTPGPHRVHLRLAPSVGPWTLVLRSNGVELIVPPGGAGGGAAPEPEPDAAPPPQPRPTPAPTPGEPPPPLPMPEPEREEAVTPIVNEGAKVRKDGAVVTARDPDAGLEPPQAQPLPEALQEFEKVLERAVGGERFSSRDRRLLIDYFQTLRRLTEPERR